MPVAERNTGPKGQAYGQKAAQDAFVAQAQEALPPEAPQDEPPAEPLSAIPEPQPIPDDIPDEMLNQGVELPGDLFAAMTGSQSEDVENMGPWADVLRNISKLPNASPVLKALADQVDRRHA